MTDRIINTLLRFTLDKQANQETLDQVRKISDALEKQFLPAKLRIEETRRKMNELRETAERLSSVSMTLGGVGAALTGPIILAANQYVQYAGKAEKTSRDWLTSTTKIEQAQIRVGRVGAQAILPYMEKAADLAERVAAYTEKHPEAIDAILKGGGGLLAISALGVALSKGVRFYADVKILQAAAMQAAAAAAMKKAAEQQLIAAGLMKGGAGAGGGATSFLPAIGPLAALVVAVMASQEVKNYLQNRAIQANPDEAKSELELLKLYRSGASLTGDQKSQLETYTKPLRGGGVTQAGVDLRVDARIRQLEQSLESLGKAAEKTSGALSLVSQQGVNMYIQYLREQKQAEEEYGRQRSQIVENYAKQRVQIEQSYEQQRTQLTAQYAKQQAQAIEAFSFNLARQFRDYQQAEAQYEAEYYRSRSDASKDFNEETQRLEQDHQRRMRELRLDHEYRMEDLIASRDALGMVREMRSYERTRKAEEETHKLEMSRRNQDFAEQLQEMEAQFAQARDERLANYEQQLADQKEDFARQQEQAREAMEDQLKQLEDQKRNELELLKKSEKDELQVLKTEYERQKNLRKTALADEYRMMEEQLGIISDKTAKWYGEMSAGYQKFIDGIKNQTSSLPGYSSGAVPGKASGGYVGLGKYMLGEQGTEFVLNAQTTRVAEAAIRGKLTQERLISAMVSSGAGGSGYHMTLNQNFSFAGSLSEAERRWFKQTARVEAEEAFIEVLRHA